MSFERHPDLNAHHRALSKDGHAASRFAQTPTASEPDPAARKQIGQILVDMGAVSLGDVARAAAMRQRQDARIGDILLAHDMVEEEVLYTALAAQFGATVAELSTIAPDARLIDAYGADACLKDGILPWHRVGSIVLIASCRPEQFEQMRPRLTEIFGEVRLAVTSETKLHEALLRSRRRKLAREAETRVAAHESCREMDARKAGRLVGSVAFLICICAIFAPVGVAFVLAAWASLLLLITTVLKVTALFAQKKRVTEDGAFFVSKRRETPLPLISVMVPLFKEREIASRLVKRLSRLNYPRELLDICLVVEEDDQVTQAELARTQLPHWMRQIIVPFGGVKTKPRALNYALNFCRGSIIGIYDAEDAPAPDQLHQVAARFAAADSKTACLQGILDFYNARTNWLSRCFTVEYATWWRIILPGYEKMGLTVPLGGTTLFFRRAPLEELGGWDAHNVTEDADLGIRLARHGYKTELINTVTDEEANCRVWPWVKQRSRWLKGYAMTYAVHMRNPRQLYRDLGPWKFFGVQALFLGALSQFLLAPLLWSFWAFPLGIYHPFSELLSREMLIGLGAMFLLSEVITIATSMIATAGRKHKWLWPWVPTLHFYYPLATLASLKALSELVTNPFYWDKTAHGLHDEEAPPTAQTSPEASVPITKPAAKPAVKPITNPADAPLVLKAEQRTVAEVLPFESLTKSRLNYQLSPTNGPTAYEDVEQRRQFAESPAPFAHASATSGMLVDLTKAPSLAELETLAQTPIPTPKRQLTFGMDVAAHEKAKRDVDMTGDAPDTHPSDNLFLDIFDDAPDDDQSAMQMDALVCKKLKPQVAQKTALQQETPPHSASASEHRYPQLVQPISLAQPANKTGMPILPVWKYTAAFADTPSFIPKAPGLRPGTALSGYSRRRS